MGSSVVSAQVWQQPSTSVPIVRGISTGAPPQIDKLVTIFVTCFLHIPQGKYAQADALYLRAIEIGEEKLGLYHPDLAKWLQDRAAMLNNQVEPA